jgi:cyanobactin maturation PatA/PatG family protease
MGKLIKRQFMYAVQTIPGLQRLWDETQGDAEICIAILDGPVDLRHPCFEGSQMSEAPTIAQSPAGDDPASQHGTHVASIIFGQHHSAILGIAPKCRGIIVPIYSSKNGGKRVCSQLDLVRAINQAIAEGAHIINISGGELTASGMADPMLEKVLKQCADSGILVVAAAGNDGCRCLHVPASIASVLAVGAMDYKGTPLDFSNWGDLYQDHGILALGRDVPGAVSGGGVTVKSGTSYAAPIVAGIAALLLSAQLKRGHEMDALQIGALLLKTADACDASTEPNCQRVLTGRLNIAAAHSKLETSKTTGIIAPQTTETPFPIYPSSSISMAGISSAKPLEIPPLQLRRNMMNETALAQITSSEMDGSGITAADYPPAAITPATLALSQGQVQASEIIAADCGCNTAKAAPTMAYVLGQIGYDFGTETKRDAFIQLSGVNIHDPASLLAYLKKDPASAANVIWTLSLDATVVYAIQPYGPFASNTYDRLKEFLHAQTTEALERVSVPGLVSGSVKLMSGQEVPVIYPDLRGMFGWSTKDLVSATVGTRPKEGAATQSYDAKVDGIKNFLERIYYEVRNLGTTAQERAMNYAATNAFQVEEVFANSIKIDMKLDSIDVERSPICRPGSDCWDVKLVFFNPAKRLEQARHVYRFTIDVSEVIPVTVGKVRHWDLF